MAQMKKGGLHKLTVQEAQNAKMAQAGYSVGTSGAYGPNDSGRYVAITALAAATVTTTSEDTDLWPTLTTVAVPVGTTIRSSWIHTFKNFFRNTCVNRRRAFYSTDFLE